MVTKRNAVRFIDNPCDDPVLMFAERMVRYGSAAPPLSFCGANLLAIVVQAFHGPQMARAYYVTPVLIAFVLGQIAVWLGVRGLRMCRGWDSGALFYLWAGAVFTSLAVCATGLFLPALIPWGAPLAATVARRRARRGGG